jgi:nucleoside-diphosphate-sugar epimerase
MIKHTIITGPTGSIGIALINHLVNLNIKVTAIVRPASKRMECIPKSPLVEVVECDISALSNLTLKGQYDAFYHFAWEGTFGEPRNNMFMQSDNIKYTLDAVHLAHTLGCKTFIFAGSQAEYGRVEGVISPIKPAFPENGYGMAKLCAGNMSRVLCNKLEIKHVWARIISVYGPYDGEYTMVTSSIIKLLKGETPDFTKCEQQWDYLYSKDAALAMYLIADKGKNNEIYCLGSGKSHPLRYFVETLRDNIDPAAKLNIGAVPYSEKQVMNLCVNIANLQDDTGFIPQYTFEEGIKETILYEKMKLKKESI